jgi:glycosyltransferase involved in cell wall biosynthesis
MSGWLEEFHRLGLVTHVDGAWSAAEPTRILSVPAQHPYVEAVRPPGAQPVAVDRVQGWAPDPALTPAGLSRYADDADVIHVHFGYERLSVAELAHWLELVRARPRPLVVTVHDLRNPHLSSNEDHQEQLRLLIAAADEVITLTPGAAAVIQQVYGRPARVIAHPTLLGPTDELPLTEPGLVTLHLKSLRANYGAPGPLARAVLSGIDGVGGRLRVDLHPEAAAHPSVAELHELAEQGELELRVHDRFSDEALVDYLSRAQVSVLPYRFGTHSGWLELCRDLGTTVVAPDCGHYVDQWSQVISYRHNEATGPDPASLAAAVATALRRPPEVAADPQARAVQRSRIRADHARVYAQARRCRG